MKLIPPDFTDFEMHVFGGPLLPLLTILLYTAVQDSNLLFCLESYNGKKGGIALNCPLPLDKDKIMPEVASMIQKNLHSASFMIHRFITLLVHCKVVMKPDFRFGVGSTILGSTSDNQSALVDWNVINFGEEFKSVRTGSAKDLFLSKQSNSNINLSSKSNEIIDEDNYDVYDYDDDDDDSVQEETAGFEEDDPEFQDRGNIKKNRRCRHRNFRWYKRRNDVNMFFPIGGVLPFQTCINTKVFKKEDPDYSINSSLKLKSNVSKLQTYLPDIR